MVARRLHQLHGEDGDIQTGTMPTKKEESTIGIELAFRDACRAGDPMVVSTEGGKGENVTNLTQTPPSELVPLTLCRPLNGFKLELTPSQLLLCSFQ